MKQFKRGFLRCKDCQAEMQLETAETAESNGRLEPQVICSNCGSAVLWEEIADKTCQCGVTPVQRDFARSAPDRGLRLYITELTDIPLFHEDGRGLVAREACTSCTECFVCKEPVATQECVWDEILLEGMQSKTGLTHQYVYMHPACAAPYDVWRTEYLRRLQEQQETRERTAEHREYCVSQGLCLECELPLGLVNRFIGRLRHPTCPAKSRSDNPTPSAKKRTKKTVKRTR